jgi:arginyl-tRNA--protein-N-Asp/Glu arginylyltransferase
MSHREPAEMLVYDELEPCPYLPQRWARMPLRLPATALAGRQLDARLAEGDRRSGIYLYRATCPGCHACEAIRIDVNQFTPSRTQQRTLRRGDRVLEVEVGPPVVDAERVALFNLHRHGRDLARYDYDIDADGYRTFLVDTCCDTLEICYRLAGSMIGVAISDRGAESVSAVYCYFDPAFSRLSPGAYSILKHIELCRRWHVRYLYLGYYVAESEHMAYKSLYLPHERLIGGRWRRFERTNVATV